MTTNDTEIAVIGAGPYGLSIAAWLRDRNVDFRIFGNPMHTWKTQMPTGMRLKSEGFASSLFDPASAFTMERYCELNGIPYADTGLPVRLETFVAYGMEFQKRMVPGLEEKTVVRLERSPTGYRLELSNGETAFAKKVVVAAGISNFQYLPPVLSGLAEEFVTHSSSHTDLSRFQGRDVTVIGGGSSAMDTAAILQGHGAKVRAIARKPAINFHNPPGPPRTFMDDIRAPLSILGPGWRSWFCVNGPLVFHRLPEAFRHKVVRKHLGPAPGWFVKEAVVGHVELNLGCELQDVRIQQNKVHVQFADANGQPHQVVTDHVIAGTGYKVDLQRLRFLSPELQKEIRTAGQAPVLAPSFESNIPGLYFAGATAANSFGPLLRFACGAGFTARHITKQLVHSSSRRSVAASASRAETHSGAQPLVAQEDREAKERKRDIAPVRG